jgi:hypothetical protein
MERFRNRIIAPVLIAFFALVGFVSCKPAKEGQNSKALKQDSISVISSNVNGTGKAVQIEMLKGKAHNHPTFAIWIEDTNGKYIQTLFVTKAISQGVFEHGDATGGVWKPGQVSRPAALPYWFHKRDVKGPDGSLVPSPQNKVPDAHSGATPAGSFKLTTRTDKPIPGKVKLLLEINQPWDWNTYWNNTLYPDNIDYQSSCQPAVVYSATVDLAKTGEIVVMKPVGHSHYSGENGELYSDLSTITSALYIAEKINVTVK